MAILGALRECNAGLQQAVQLQLESGEVGDVLTEIENMLETVARLKEKVTVSQLLEQKIEAEQEIEAEASKLVLEGTTRCMDGNCRASIRSNLTHIFLNSHDKSTAAIVKELRILSYSDPDLLMVFAFTMRVRSWTNRNMGKDKYDVVIEKLKAWNHKPWEEEVLQTLDDLKKGILMNSELFGVFHGHTPDSIFAVLN